MLPVRYVLGIFAQFYLFSIATSSTFLQASKLQTAYNRIQEIFHSSTLHLMNYHGLNFQPSSNSKATPLVPIISTDVSSLTKHCFLPGSPSTATSHWKLYRLQFTSYSLVHIFLAPTGQNVKLNYMSEPPTLDSELCIAENLYYFWVDVHAITDLGFQSWTTPQFSRPTDYHILLLDSSSENHPQDLIRYWLNSYNGKIPPYSFHTVNKLVVQLTNWYFQPYTISIMCEFCQEDCAVSIATNPMTVNQFQVDQLLNIAHSTVNVPIFIKNFEHLLGNEDLFVKNGMKQRFRYTTLTGPHGMLIDGPITPSTFTSMEGNVLRIILGNVSVVKYNYQEDPVTYPFNRFPVIQFNDPDSFYFVLRHETFEIMTCDGGYLDGTISFADFISPFDTWTWTLAAVGAFGISIFLMFTKRINTFLKCSYFEVISFPWAALVEQANFPCGYSVSEYLNSLRWAVGSWLLVSVVLTTGYLGDNITNLNSPRLNILLKTLSDFSHRNFTILLEKPPALMFVVDNGLRNCDFDNRPCRPEMHSKLYENYVVHQYLNRSKSLSVAGQQELKVLQDIMRMGRIAKMGEMATFAYYGYRKVAYGDWTSAVDYLDPMMRKRWEFYSRIKLPSIKRALGWAVKRWRPPKLHERFSILENAGLVQFWKSLIHILEVRRSKRIYAVNLYSEENIQDINYKMRKRARLSKVSAVSINSNLVSVFFVLLMGTALSIISFSLEFKTRLSLFGWQVVISVVCFVRQVIWKWEWVRRIFCGCRCLGGWIEY